MYIYICVYIEICNVESKLQMDNSDIMPLELPFRLPGPLEQVVLEYLCVFMSPEGHHHAHVGLQRLEWRDSKEAAATDGMAVLMEQPVGTTVKLLWRRRRGRQGLYLD